MAKSKSLQLGVRMFVGEFWHTGEENWREVLKNNHSFLREAIKKGALLAGIKC